jgi:hypothetical protein
MLITLHLMESSSLIYIAASAYSETWNVNRHARKTHSGHMMTALSTVAPGIWHRQCTCLRCNQHTKLSITSATAAR